MESKYDQYLNVTLKTSLLVGNKKYFRNFYTTRGYLFTFKPQNSIYFRYRYIVESLTKYFLYLLITKVRFFFTSLFVTVWPQTCFLRCPVRWKVCISKLLQADAKTPDSGLGAVKRLSRFSSLHFQTSHDRRGSQGRHHSLWLPGWRYFCCCSAGLLEKAFTASLYPEAPNKAQPRGRFDLPEQKAAKKMQTRHTDWGSKLCRECILNFNLQLVLFPPVFDQNKRPYLIKCCCGDGLPAMVLVEIVYLSTLPLIDKYMDDTWTWQQADSVVKPWPWP